MLDMWSGFALQNRIHFFAISFLFTTLFFHSILPPARMLWNPQSHFLFTLISKSIFMLIKSCDRQSNWRLKLIRFDLCDFNYMSTTFTNNWHKFFQTHHRQIKFYSMSERMSLSKLLFYLNFYSEKKREPLWTDHVVLRTSGKSLINFHHFQ